MTPRLFSITTAEFDKLSAQEQKELLDEMIKIWAAEEAEDVQKDHEEEKDGRYR